MASITSRIWDKLSESQRFDILLESLYESNPPNLNDLASRTWAQLDTLTQDRIKEIIK